jgi:hypothetical protein
LLQRLHWTGSQGRPRGHLRQHLLQVGIVLEGVSGQIDLMNLLTPCDEGLHHRNAQTAADVAHQVDQPDT